MTFRTVLKERIAEKTSAKVTAVIKDEDGNAIPSGSLDSLKLTLYVKGTDTHVNSRDAQNVLNANDVTVDAQGNLTWLLRPEDTVMNGTGTSEVHVALFEWAWNGGTKAGKHEIEMTIVNLSQVS
jgi:hypothetical protein